MVKSWSRCYHTVWALMAIFVVVGAVGAAGGEQGTMYDALKLTRQGVLDGEVWRLVSYPFITSGPLSLLFTVLIFYYIGMPLELIWGTARFLTLFLVSVLGAAAAGVLLNVPLGGDNTTFGDAPIVTLMLIYGFLFPESIIYLFLILPIRIKTLSIIITAWYLVQCAAMKLQGLALFAGLFSGVLFYVLTTGEIPWLRRAKRKLREAAADPSAAVRSVSTGSLMERARQAMRRHDSGQPLTEQDRAWIEEVIRRADPEHELCSPYSFSPDNTICPPCRAFGHCLRRYLETVEKED
jgi:membrane associated rhomboid family serine protease